MMDAAVLNVIQESKMCREERPSFCSVLGVGHFFEARNLTFPFISQANQVLKWVTGLISESVNGKGIVTRMAALMGDLCHGTPPANSRAMYACFQAEFKHIQNSKARSSPLLLIWSPLRALSNAKALILSTRLNLLKLTPGFLLPLFLHQIF